jgi:hypothetical protein
MDPRVRLENGQKAAREGRFEDALNEYIWFHEHALEHDQGYYGVRLSFALGFWMELADSYPAAKDKILEIRDRKAALLASGNGNRALFHDVEAINEFLGEEKNTYDLFVTMTFNSPQLAISCAEIAIDTIVKIGDFALAEKYSMGPEDSLLRFSEDLNRDIADPEFKGKHRAHTIEAFIQIYCGRVQTMISILEGLGKTEEAGQAREWAVALVHSKQISVRVGEILLGIR